MKTQRIVFYAACVPRRLLIALILSIFVSCNLNEFKKQEEKLKPLVQQRASKAELINLLGGDFILYSKGQTNWQNLTQYLAREPRNRLVAVRERAAKWPIAMLYSTPDMVTWVFLDEDEKVVDFVVGAQ